MTRLAAESETGEASRSGGGGVAGAEEALLRHRIEQFTLVGVISAAVVDSINPCAISAIIFFISLLSAARVGVRRMWISGLSFLVACFLTYLAIGFGLLKALGFFAAFRGMREVLDGVLIVVMGGFAFLSFRDAMRYSRSGRAADVVLKLPVKLQALIHRVMKRGLQTRHLVLGGLGIGLVVTVLESVCTGQVYVPALVMMLKSGQSILRCAVYLVVYNVVFIMPLLVVLVLTCAGLKTPVLVEWSRRNVVVSKTLLGLLFVGMMLLLVWFH
jgi:cytochrome c biogenesis protein CcdA